MAGLRLASRMAICHQVRPAACAELIAAFFAFLFSQIPPCIGFPADRAREFDGQPAAVFDAKYKLEDDSPGYPNADIYQMLAYCAALRLTRGWLVYAQGSAASNRVLHTSIEIAHYPLDLTRSPADLLLQVSDLARRAVSRLESSSVGCLPL